MNLAGPVNNFDGIRLLGALLVVFSHQFAVSGVGEPRVLGDHSFGNLGVLIFFSISGYLVTTSWVNDPHLFRFLARRMLRLWPGLAVVVSLSALVAYMCATDEVGRGMALQYLSMLWFQMSDGQFFLGNPQKFLGGPLWTIPIEFGCYVALAVTAALTGKVFLPMLTAGTILLLVFFVTGADLATWISTGSPIIFMGYFGAFFIAGSLLQFLPKIYLFRVLFGSIPLAIFAALVGQPTLALLCVVPVTVIVIGVRSWPVIRNTARFGDLSYGIYLYAWPVQQLGILWYGRELPWGYQFMITLVLTLPLAYASWHLIEKRALRMKPTRRDAFIAKPQRDGT